MAFRTSNWANRNFMVRSAILIVSFLFSGLLVNFSGVENMGLLLSYIIIIY